VNLILVVGVTLAIGIGSGLRAFTPIALVSWLSIWGWIPLAGSPLWFLGTNTCAIIASLAAIGELIADKFPKIPSRILPGPLGVRIVTGAVSAGALFFAAGRSWFFGLPFGALGSVVGAFGGYYGRQFLTRRLPVPDLMVALLEDFLTIAGTLLLVHSFFGTSI
jgi:uncharacterized membrane protein